MAHDTRGKSRLGRTIRTRPTGLPAWLVQRAGAVYMLLFLVGMLVLLALHPLHSYAEWKSWVARPIVTLALALFFAALLSHMWVGLRDVLLDYARPASLRRILLGMVALGLFAAGLGMAWLLVLQHV
jgi:succinate dehydrogenase / fumarate reductase membrane anchor subunit